jgi:hypothetical protein
VFADADLPADLSIGDDATPVADAALDSQAAQVSEPPSVELPESFEASNTGGFAGFNYTDEQTAREEGLQFPAGLGSISGDINDDGTWQSTDVSFDPLKIEPAPGFELSGQLSIPDGLTGTLDIQNNFLNASGELVVDVAGDSFSFDVTLTTGKSGAMEGSADLNESGGTATLVANDFAVPETSGNGILDQYLGLPLNQPGKAFIELPLDITTSAAS